MQVSVTFYKEVSMSKRTKYQIAFIAGVLVILIICNALVGGKLLSFRNIRTIISNSVFPVFTAFGLCFIFTGGLIDLSVGANILLSANFGAFLAESMGLGYPGLILGGILCAVVCEQLCVQWSLTLHIPAWISGLGSALILEAILAQWSAVLASKSQKLPNLTTYRALGKMPTMGIVLLIGFIAAYIIFNKTSLGINLQAIGGNAAVAEVMGVKVKKTILLATVVGGIFAGCAAITNISFTGKLDCSSGLNSLSTIFKALAATLLADSIQNIFTKPVGILLSGIAVVALFNILTLFGVPSGTYQNIVLGFVVIFCGILSHLRDRGVVK